MVDGRESGQQHSHHVFLAGGGGDDERRDRTFGHLCAVATRTHQGGDDVGAAHFGRHMARAHASAVGDRRVSARFDQLLHDLDAALARCRHQCRQTIVPA